MAENEFVIGAHVSMKAPDYFLGSVQEALQYEANTLMLYTGAPQNFRRVPIEQLKIAEAQNLIAVKGLNIRKFIVHAPYLINLANVLDPSVLTNSIELLRRELERTAAFGIPVLVLHPGSHGEASHQAGLDSVIKSLDLVLGKDDSSVKIALETMPGGGTQVGSTFSDLAYIIKNSRYPQRLGVCLDTCHMYSSGFDLAKIEEVLAEIDGSVGLDRVLCVHFNDSKFPLGSHKDRHENIGYGTIGFSVLYQWLVHPKLQCVPFILETPYVGNRPPYQKEIALLRTGHFIPNWRDSL